MSESNNNTPMRITQLEEATAYEDGMYYAVAKAGSGTKKILSSIVTPYTGDLMANQNVKIDLSFVQGSIYPDTGSEYNTNSYIRSGYIKIENYMSKIHFEIDSGYFYLLRYYYDIGKDNYHKGGSTHKTGSFDYVPDGVDKYIRVIVGRNDSANISPTEGESCSASFVPIIEEDIQAIKNESESFENLITSGYYSQQTTTGYAIKNSVAVGAVVDLNPVAVDNLASLVVEGIKTGMKFKVFGSGTYYYVLWAWLDKDNKLISKAAAWHTSGSSGDIIIAPEGAKKLVCSSNYNYVYGFNAQYIESTGFLGSQLEKISNVIDTEKTEKNLLKNSSFAFAFFSDIHGGETNAQKIVDFAEEKELNCIINGGDTVLRYLNDPDNDFSWYENLLNNCSIDFLSAVGNHDVWDGAYWTKAANTTIYNAIIAPIITNYENIQQPTDAASEGLCYYYKDYESLRLIVLNAMSGESSVNFWTEAQAEWLTDVLTDAKTNSKHVIICNHSPFPKNIALRDEKSNWNSYLDYRTYASSDDIVMNTNALSIIQNFVNSNGILVCLLTGHEHIDSILTASGLDGQFMINIASAKFSNHPDGIAYTSVNSPYYNCFDYCAVDTTSGILKLVRVGWNMDASLKERNSLSYDYINKKLLHE